MALNLIKFSEFAAGSLDNDNYIVGVTALSGGTNFRTPAVNSWTTAGRPVTPITGTLGYNTDLSQYEYWNGATWVQFAAGGSGTVGLGGAGQIAYYASNGTAVSGTNTIPNTVATQGIINGTNATAGNVGEFISSTINSGTPYVATNNNAHDLTTISLTAGDWDLNGNVSFDPVQPGAAIGYIVCWISTVSSSQPDSSLYNSVAYDTGVVTLSGISTPFLRLNVTTTTTVYLSFIVQLDSGIANITGGVYARRVR